MAENFGSAGARSRVSVGGTDIAYRYTTASERQPLLLFLHEGLGSISLWRDVPDEIGSRTGLPALVYDRQGYGQSDPLQRERTPSYLHDYAWQELPALLDALGERRPLILVGHSDGGTIALLYASRFADRVRGVVTEAAHVSVEQEALDGIRDAEREFDRGRLRERLARHHGDKTETTFRAWSDTWSSARFLGWSIESEIRAVECPILAMQGANDEYGTPAQLDAIAAHVNGPCRLLLIPDCGHTPHLDARGTAVHAIVDFVAELVGSE